MIGQIPDVWDFPTPGQLYPVPQLTLVREEGRILRVAPAAKAQMAAEILQLGMVFHEDTDHPPEVVTGVADAIKPGQEGLVRRWIDQLVLRGNVVLVFLHTVVKGPIRFVATTSPTLVAALAQPAGVMRNYAVLDGPEYLIRQAQQLAQGGKATWGLPQAQQTHSFVSGKATAEGSLATPVPTPPATPVPVSAGPASPIWPWVGAAAIVGAALWLIVRQR